MVERSLPEYSTQETASTEAFYSGTPGRCGSVQRLEGHTDQVFDVSFSADGRVLASSSADDTVRLWDLTTGEQIGEPLVGHSDDVHALAFDPSGTDLVSRVPMGQ